MKVRRCSCSAHGSFLTAKGLEEAAQRLSLEGLAPRGELVYVDRVGSVSALAEAEDPCVWPPDHILEAQSERFHNGS